MKDNCYVVPFIHKILCGFSRVCISVYIVFNLCCKVGYHIFYYMTSFGILFNNLTKSLCKTVIELLVTCQMLPEF